jgi:hypothetical protein
MIGHQAKSNDAMTKPLDAFLKEKTKPATVFIIKKDVLSGVATKGDMVQVFGDNYPVRSASINMAG